jgi:predicted RNA-binding Zn-ribbon protein involved in translation (DUF1610 family)
MGAEPRRLVFFFCSRQSLQMHPPRFLPSHLIADWPDCHLELGCPQCGKVAIVALRMFCRDHGHARVLDLVDRLRCQGCGTKAAPVHLCASTTRSFGDGPKADWAIELVAGAKAAS